MSKNCGADFVGEAVIFEYDTSACSLAWLFVSLVDCVVTVFIGVVFSDDTGTKTWIKMLNGLKQSTLSRHKIMM